MARQMTRNQRRLAVTSLETRLAPAVFTVTNTLDSGPGSLRAAVAAANALAGPDQIRFALVTPTPGPAVIPLTTGEIAITDSVSILGAPSNTPSPTPIPPDVPAPRVVLDAGNASRIFNINAPEVLSISLVGLALTRGRTTGAGGAILNVGENVSLTGCVLSANEATGHGGAIETIGVSAGTVNSRPPAVLLNNTRVIGNRGADGGGIHFTGPGSFSAMASTLADNRASGKGGAVALGLGGQVSIDSCTISGNTATTSGGGLQFTGGLNSLPAVNAVPILIRNSTFSANSAQGSGGAISLASFGNSSMQIANCTIALNTAGLNSPALTTAGGGIFVLPSSNTTSLGRIAIVSSVVSGNRAVFGPDIQSLGPVAASYSAIGSRLGIGNFLDRGFNLPFGADLRLGPLANNGGPTLTHMPAADSPLVDHGSNPFHLRFDQRGYGFFRIVGGQADIGAVERPARLSPLLAFMWIPDVEPRER